MLAEMIMNEAVTSLDVSFFEWLKGIIMLYKLTIDQISYLKIRWIGKMEHLII